MGGPAHITRTRILDIVMDWGRGWRVVLVLLVLLLLSHRCCCPTHNTHVSPVVGCETQPPTCFTHQPTVYDGACKVV